VVRIWKPMNLYISSNKYILGTYYWYMYLLDLDHHTVSGSQIPKSHESRITGSETDIEASASRSD